ncbi:MAG: YgfZ/GcvT domain-containing protein [Acidimicrobiales bacterium]
MTGGAWVSVERDVVEVRGPDAMSFLQGQCSQDLLRLGAGDSAWSFVLQPTGKLDHLVRVTRQADDVVLLDVDAGSGPALVARLQRFKLRVRAELVRDDGWWASRPPATDAESAGPQGAVRVVGWWGQGSWWLGPVAVAGAVPLDERDRIEAGWPAAGAELTPEVIPAECGLVPLAVSFTKGCYTGQELVARIDSRGGNVPRRLCRLVPLDGATISPGDHLLLDGAEVGWVTSAASPAELVGELVAGPGAGAIPTAGAVGLGYVGRAVELGAVVHAGPVPVTVLAQRSVPPEVAADRSSAG